MKEELAQDVHANGAGEIDGHVPGDAADAFRSGVPRGSRRLAGGDPGRPRQREDCAPIRLAGADGPKRCVAEAMKQPRAAAGTEGRVLVQHACHDILRRIGDCPLRVLGGEPLRVADAVGSPLVRSVAPLLERTCSQGPRQARAGRMCPTRSDRAAHDATAAAPTLPASARCPVRVLAPARLRSGTVT